MSLYMQKIPENPLGDGGKPTRINKQIQQSWRVQYQHTQKLMCFYLPTKWNQENNSIYNVKYLSINFKEIKRQINRKVSCDHVRKICS